MTSAGCANDFSVSSPFLPTCLSGTVAVVTGGGSGIGLIIAEQLGVHGAKVVVMGRRAQFLEKAVARLSGQGVDCAMVQGDVRDCASCANVCAFANEKYGGLSALVNCAAGNFLSAAEDLSSNAYSTVLSIDAVGSFNMSQAALPYLKKARNPNIVNITVNSKWLEGRMWYQLHAASAKAAISTMATAMALEWGTAYGVRVNCVGPGIIDDTPALSKMATDENRKILEAGVPLGRLGKRFEIAMAVLYCNVSPYMTGETVVIDGGEWIHPGKPPVPRNVVAAMARQAEKASRKVRPDAAIPSKL